MKGRSRRLLLELFETLVLTVVVFLGIQTFVAQPYRVEGGSMEMTVLPDQYVLVDKLTPRWAPYKLGDIVVLDPPTGAPGGGATPFIKRVIGVAGDQVELKDGYVYLNGSRLLETYVFAEDGVPQSTEQTGDASIWVVPAGSVFVMGDHRQSSSDSRMFGPVEIAHVLGRAWLRYWPLDAFGTIGSAGPANP